MVDRRYIPKFRAAIEDQVEVPLPEDMDNETFLKHIELRHAKECKIEGFVHRHNVHVWIGMYRIFHDRLHKLAAPGQHDHYHAGDDEE